MSSVIKLQFDVLASSPEEKNEIEAALTSSSVESIAWRAQLSGMEPKNIAECVQAIVTFTSVGDPSVDTVSRFELFWKDKFWGMVWGRVHFVSRCFPNAVFLAQYWDDQASSGGKSVIRDGDSIRNSHDDDHRAQAEEWVLPNIFAPYWAEYQRGLKFGSLWNEWLEGMRKELDALAARDGGPTGTVTTEPRRRLP